MFKGEYIACKVCGGNREHDLRTGELGPCDGAVECEKCGEYIPCDLEQCPLCAQNT